MGEVWRATHDATGASVAVKLIRSDLAEDADFRGAFAYEVRTMAALDTAGVVRVLDLGEVSGAAAAASGGALEAGSPYVAMEWMSGGSLAERPLPRSWAEAAALLEALLVTLADVHACGVLHRDIKPANVLLAGPEVWQPGWKLADFGLAWALEGRNALRYAGSGTPRFMAPEQIRGEADGQGPWTDLYALGCLAWLLATGESPYEGDVQSVFHGHLGAPLPPFNPRFPAPAGAREWLGLLLRKHPRERFSLAADALAALRSLGDAAPGLAPAAVARELDGATRVDPSATLTPDATVPESSLSGGTLAEGASLSSLSPGDETAPEPLEGSDATLSEGELLDATAAEILAEAEEPQRGEMDLPRREPPPPAPPLADWRPDPPSEPLHLGTGLRLVNLRPPPLTGREEERDALWWALREVGESGRARAVLLQGAAGCGKSRLAEWLCRRANAAGMASFVRAQHGPVPGPADGLEPALARALGLVGLSVPEASERLGRTLDLQQRILPGRADRRALARHLLGREELLSEGERLAQLADALQAMAHPRPLILWIDDLQWGAPALAALTHLLRLQEQRPFPLLIVGTASVEALAALPDQAARLRRFAERDAAEALTLAPLEPRQQGILVQRLVHLSPELFAQVLEKTAGNPLFAVHLLRSWAAQGRLEDRGNGLALTDDADLPADLLSAWGARLDDLLRDRPGDSLEIAAVLGVEVDGGEWQRACAAARVEPDWALLGELIDACLALPGPDGPRRRWSFVHGMLREAILARAQAGGRVAGWSRAAAAAIAPDGAAVPAVDAERYGLLLLAAGDPAAAIDPLMTAATERISRHEYSRALALLQDREAALAAAGVPAADGRWGDGWASEMNVRWFLGYAQEARQIADRALEAGRRYGWRGSLFRILLARTQTFLNAGDPGAALPLSAEALPLTESGGSDRQRVMALLNRAQTCTRAGLLAETEGALRRIEALNFPMDRGLELVLLHAQGELRWARGELRQAEELLARGLGGDDTTFPWMVALLSYALGGIALQESRLDDADRWFQRGWAAFAFLELVGNPMCLFKHALLDLARGDREAALARLERIRGEPYFAQARGFAAEVDLGLAWALAETARWPDALAKLRAAGAVLRDCQLHHPNDLFLADRLAAAADAGGEAELAAEARDLAAWIAQGLGR